MSRDISNGIPVAEIERAIMKHLVSAGRSITTPELAEALDVSVSIARWAVSHCPDVELYDGNSIRFKGRPK